MKDITFKEFLIGVYVETAEFYGGQKRGWENYDHIDQVPDWWWGWLSKKLATDEKTWLPRIIVDGSEWNRDQIISHIRQKTGGGGQPAPAPTPRPTPPTPRPPTPGKPQPPVNQGNWWLATAKMDETLPDHNGVEHTIKKGQHVALKKNSDTTWAYATIWKGKLQWHNANMPQEELGGRFERVTVDGQPVRGMKASQLAKSVHKEEKKEFDLTDEQRDISETFQRNKDAKDANHMVINALAGTGKTTMLRHLAEKYGKRGEKWLYLVFGRKNKEEATGEFPDFVDVYTTNSYAGQVLENNKINPTERIAEYGDRVSKVEEIIDGQQYQQVANSVNVPHFSDPGIGKYIKSYMKGIWREFNMEVQKLCGLAKAYNLNPDNAKAGIQEISGEHDINSELERTKERLEKDSNVDFFNEQISEFMGIDDFLSKDFLDEMIECATWVLDKSQPHGIDQDFMQTHEKKNGRWQKMAQPIKRNLRTLRDFDDDLWYAAMHADELDWSRPKKYQYVLVDEVQDFNKAQKVILEKLVQNGARVVAVGDPNQCHPAGTMISMTGGEQKPIEEIQEGDEVVTYNSKKSYFPGTNSQGRKVEGIACRQYSGPMIKLSTTSSSQKCTPNHRCLTRFDAENKCCLYLMIKGESARIGTCRLNYSEGFGLSYRAKSEKADKAWLLKIYDNDVDARLDELVISAKYGLLQTIFENTGQHSTSQWFIDEAYKQMGNCIPNATRCLEHFDRMIEYPLWTKEKQTRHGELKQNYIGSTKSFVTQACNLISDHMLVRTFDGSPRGGAWEKVTIDREQDSCPVYSLKVEATEGGRRLYVANNITVHNSMYRFRGADDAAFKDITAMLSGHSSNPKGTEKTLTKNFRSKPGIIDHSNQNTVVDNLVAGRDHDPHDPAHISNREIKYDETLDRLGHEMESIGEMKKQTAFIARTNEPLAKAAMDLLKHKIPFVIYGRDMASDVINLVNRVQAWQKYKVVNDDSGIDEFRSELGDFVEEKKEKWSGKATKAGPLKDLLEAQKALYSAIEVVQEEGEGSSVKDFKTWLYRRLGGVPDYMTKAQKAAHKKMLEEQNPVILTTAHRSKGLEFDRVYELTPSLYPHPRTKLDADFAQEENSRYVAGTRAKDEYHVVDDTEDE
tara:strand:+ start:38245 stop:41646 length:3402 start_codon:yes stop_codon:yes gene_type:complete